VIAKLGMKVKLKRDKYRKNRGGNSKFLDIFCESCGTHLFYYQKDGLGILKRLYLDRIIGSKEYSNLEHMALKDIPNLACLSCKDILGVPYIYPKEKRLAFRLFAGEVSKKIVKSNQVSEITS